MKIASNAGSPAIANGIIHQNLADIGQQREGDPVEPEHEMPEAEPPAGEEGGTPGGGPLQQPEQSGKSQQQHRNGAGRRQG